MEARYLMNVAAAELSKICMASHGSVAATRASR